MPSELQRVARGLVDCFDEIPRVVEQLTRTAARCRENAQLALLASRGQATVAAQQLDAAARACEAAAHFLSMAPPKARGWAEGLVGDRGPSTNRPSSGSADRNRATGGSADLKVRRLTISHEDVEVVEDDEPPLITVARKAFEAYRKAHEKDDDTAEPEPLELEITVTETGELIFDEADKSEDQKRAERLTRDFEFAPKSDEEVPELEEPDEKETKQRTDRLTRDFELTPDLTEAVKALLETLSEDRQWEHATLTITTDLLEATFDDPEDSPPAPIIVDIELPDMESPDGLEPDGPRTTPIDADFDPGAQLGALGDDFVPDVFDPHGRFLEKEKLIGRRLAENGWRVDARPADHSSKEKNPDALVRTHRDDEGAIVEFKTQDVGESNAVKRSMLRASGQALKATPELEARREIVIDGRRVGLSEETALRSFRRAVGQPHSTLVRVVHVILGDGRLVTFTKEQ